MDPALDEAFRAARYRVGKIDLVMGEPTPALDLLLEARELADWAFLTAWNPGGRQRDEATNRSAQQRLVEAVGARQVLRGHAEAPDGSWREPSLLVLGMGRAEAVEVARAFGQAAILVGERGGRVQLVWV